MKTKEIIVDGITHNVFPFSYNTETHWLIGEDGSATDYLSGYVNMIVSCDGEIYKVFTTILAGEKDGVEHDRIWSIRLKNEVDATNEMFEFVYGRIKSRIVEWIKEKFVI